MRACAGRRALLCVAATAGVFTSAAPGNAVSFNVGSASGTAGTEVQFAVTLSTTNMQVAGTSNDIAFDPATPAVSCTVSPAFAGLSGAILLPDNCTPGVDCLGARVLIIQFPPIPITDGAILYTCDVKISAGTAGGSYPLTCLAPSASDPDGKELPAQCVDGQLQVLPAPTATVTPTPTITSTTTPTGTTTPTRTATGTPLPGGGGGGGGCEVAPLPHSLAYVLLLPAAALLWRRRRVRLPTRGG
jgi:hypothetical protein